MAFENFREYKYHFTSCAGLYGMLKECTKDNPYLTMWATHSSFMNDSSEYEYGRDMCIKVFETYEKNENIYKTERSIFKDGKKQISDFLTKEAPFLISLSKNTESAAMWSMYSVNGSGIALKFDIATINRYINNSKRRINFTECIYQKTATDILKEHGPYIHVLHNLIYSQISKSSNDGLPEALLVDLASQIKHPSYAYENEHRLVVEKENRDVEFRIRDNVIIPYIKVKLPIDALCGIVIGPTANDKYIRKSLEMYLNSLDCDRDVINRIIKHIKSSEVPYRG